MIRLALSTLALIGAPAAQAEVVASAAGGFVSRHEIAAPVTPEKAYAAFVRVQDWWDGAHSFSGVAKNLRIEARPGGCWCEKLSRGGFVEHLRVTHAAPGERLTLSGGLGPLGAMAVAGAFAVEFAAAPDGSKITWTYAVNGYARGGMAALAAPVDAVLTEQAGRYRAALAAVN
jgi:hypothetical protein